jgi:ABC-type sugar transport system ATPase subunit
MEGKSQDFGSVIAQTRAVNKRYPGVHALKSVDFTVHAGEVRALLGANGAGKSTLIRLLAGVETPDDGTVEIAGMPLDGGVRGASKLGVSTVYQELSLIPGMSVAENLFLGHWLRGRAGIDVRAMEDAARTTLSRIGAHIDPGREVASLTLAEQQIVEIARAVHEDPKLLILDEPTSALAAHEVDLVLDVVRKVAARGVGVIYVSHRMDELRQIADTVTVMRDGRHIATTDVRGASTQHIIDLMLGETAAKEQLAYEGRALGDVKLNVVELRVPPKIDEVSFSVRQGEILGIAGLLGSGRTELLRAVAGFEKPASGIVEVNGVKVRNHNALHIKNLGVGLTPEDRKREGIVTDLSIAENMVMSDYTKVSTAGVLQPSLISRAAGALRRRLDMKAENLDHSIATLSGGNQQKAVIGRWLHAGSNVLLLDEPTRGVDVGSKAQIYDIMRQLAADGAAVVFISSELEELPLVCDRVIVLRDGRLTAEFRAPQIRAAELLAAAMATEEEN